MASSSSTRPQPSFGQNHSNASDEGSSSRAGPRIVQPRPQGPRIAGAQSAGNTILVNSCQKGNPILQFIRNIGWEYGDIVADYQVGATSCILFLSLRYHRLHPEYVHTRINKLQQAYGLRILLVMCDVNDHQAAIKELTKVAVVNNMTIMVAWSAEEAGRYVEAYKILEHKPTDVIKERISDDYMSQLTSVLTSVRGVNKTDVTTLLSNFGSLQRIATAAPSHLLMCPGFGDVKVRRLREAFSQPFRAGETRTRAERIAAGEHLVGLKETITPSTDKTRERRPHSPANASTAAAAAAAVEQQVPQQHEVEDANAELFDLDFFGDDLDDLEPEPDPEPELQRATPAKRPRIQMGDD
ncbi:unnamed protein product [Tilletia controversa]|uniref:DNA excision repair protein ERCC-1 n=3 Tax=Tilletia TaxID=13289 RepID=A0A8X7T0M9_9BASI|nr:hypothetical protein CF336_g4758 [Tilletia laevis]KAE8194025.1 hypothetical protein CF328_g4882 [Tilletia controversa]KAE8257775.1 hypothetical protein A4X03_0g4566 [Tilletia caries]KAE8197618.1 hypothetical protein CF335_g4572 [Tilletia laevis]KAE8255738.1 hypothetical protein A4X06_0g290 [Tilletia controversa]